MCLWPGYNRKVAACLAPRTCRRNLGPSAHAHQLQPAPREACPTRCDCVLHSHAIIPGGFGVLYSSSFPSPFLQLLFSAFLLREQLTRLLITDLSRPITSSVCACYYHRLVYARRFSHSPALPPTTHTHAHTHTHAPWPVSCPALPTPFFRRDDASSRYRVSQSNICPPALCSTSVLPTDWTG